ncbi:hypothetical protein BC936DRAFT_143452 [Jimgerdemannia flammicorona]|uniref:Peptidase M20 dimerisation domain-containing protein n=1 Tax=Jimgerdemannia flammicorona TaxID=994334 RepID=A0A433DDY2_9FUNG|nr:hypothetical protein BC936DRAFT_143452 [Jimgerdemannia flammicorona]
MAPHLQNFFAYVDSHQEGFIDRLRKAVEIPSVSGDAAYRNEVFRMGEFMATELKKLGASVQKRDVGTQVLNGQTIQLPPIILSTYGTDPTKKTVLVYGHYDVQPALKEDGWNTEPFELVEDAQHRLNGRGSTDDKGPILGWLNVIEAHQYLGVDLPVNLKMCFEGMEESGSEGLDELIIAEAKGYFADVDAVCISDNYWLGTKKPCLTYGLRGINYFLLEVKGPSRDLHSGVFGGTVHEPMTDLTLLLSKLVTPNGEILIPGISDDVAVVTASESSTYNTLDFEIGELEEAVGSKTLIHNTAKEALMHRWRYPSLSLHGIEGAFYAPGEKTVVPAKVIGKFSIRSVPDMDPERITELVTHYVKAEFAKLGSKNTISIRCTHGAKPWVATPNHWNYVAAAKAVKHVFNVDPDYTREGGSIPVTLTFQDALGKNVLLLPMGRGDDVSLGWTSRDWFPRSGKMLTDRIVRASPGAHSINEKLDRSNYIEGIKLLGAYLYEIAAVQT